MPDPDYKLGRLGDRWVVSWWEDGKRKRYRLEAGTRQEAERAKADFVIGLSRRDGVTVEALWKAYVREKEGRRVTRAMGFEWAFLAPYFGHLEPKHITVELCRTYIKARRSSGKRGTTGDGTIWTELGHLRTVMIWAWKRRLIEFAPPIERPSKPKPKERHLTRAEAERLLASATMPHIRGAIILLLTTAARVGAILDLTWDRVDLDRKFIRLALPDAGTRKGRATVPINNAAMAVLQELRKGALTANVIEWRGAPVLSIKTGFYAAAKAADLPGVSPHVLRHTAAVWMAESGVDMEEIAQYLGHEDSRITRRVYARFSPAHLAKAAEALEFGRPALTVVK